jgi:hypothetical protein
MTRSMLLGGEDPRILPPHLFYLIKEALQAFFSTAGVSTVYNISRVRFSPGQDT